MHDSALTRNVAKGAEILVDVVMDVFLANYSHHIPHGSIPFLQGKMLATAQSAFWNEVSTRRSQGLPIGDVFLDPVVSSRVSAVAVLTGYSALQESTALATAQAEAALSDLRLTQQMSSQQLLMPGGPRPGIDNAPPSPSYMSKGPLARVSLNSSSRRGISPGSSSRSLHHDSGYQSSSSTRSLHAERPGKRVRRRTEPPIAEETSRVTSQVTGRPSMFVIPVHPKETQRKSYPSESRYLAPNPMRIRYDGRDEFSGSAIVSLVDEQGVALPEGKQKALIGGGVVVPFRDNAAEFTLRMFEPCKQICLAFDIIYSVTTNGNRIEHTERVVSRPFSVVSNLKKKSRKKKAEERAAAQGVPMPMMTDGGGASSSLPPTPMNMSGHHQLI
jgi:hypothetical protein